MAASRGCGRVRFPMTTQFAIDSTHSSAAFEVSHIGISTFRNGFRTVTGTLALEEGIVGSKLEATIDPKSLNSDNKGLVGAVFGADFLDVEKYPEITYKSSSFEKAGSGWKVKGELTIRGVSKPVELTVTDLGTQVNPFVQKAVRAVKATATVDRGEFGIVWNVPLDNGGKYLGEKITVTLDIELIPV